MDQERRKFAVRRGMFGTGLPVAVLMSIFFAFQRPGHVLQFQNFRPNTFLLGMLLFTPIFLVAGYFWGVWVYASTKRQP